MSTHRRPPPREQIGLPLYPAGVQRAMTAQRFMARCTTHEPRTTRSYAPVPPVVEEDEMEDEVYPPRLPSSAVRYMTPVRQTATPLPAHAQGRTQVVIERRRRIVQPPSFSEPPEPQAAPHRARLHWLVMLGLGMLLMLFAWVGLSLLLQWWQVQQDDAHYGRPRTFQLDGVVGHQDSASTPTHLLVINLNRHVIVTEYPGGDARHARVYLGPVLFGPGQDLAPVTLRLKDVNGDGTPDLLIDIQGQTVVFLNDGQMFRPLKPGEQVSV